MTFAKLIMGTFAAMLLLTAIKIFFIRFLNIDSQIMVYLMWLFLAVATIAIVRRLGVLNYLEAFFVTAILLITTAFTDVVTIGAMTDYDVYRQAYFLLTYVVLIVSVIVFHKKAHVHIRKAFKAKMNQQDK